MVVNVPALITLLILTVAVILLLFNVTRPDLIALLVLISLGLTSVVTPGDLFSGFSRSAVITVMALFIMTNGLYRTGVTRWMGERLLQLGGRQPWRLTLTVMLAGAVLSYFMNTIAAGAVLLPAIIGIARTTDIRPSKLLIPLSYGTLLGGMATLLTTSSILINAALRDANFQPFQLLDFLPVGGAMAVAGILFMTVIGRRWLPTRSPIDRYGWDARYQVGVVRSLQSAGTLIRSADRTHFAAGRPINRGEPHRRDVGSQHSGDRARPSDDPRAQTRRSAAHARCADHRRAQ